MKDNICCFAGHRKIYNIENLKHKVYKKCEELILYKNINTFWVGNYGDFDNLSARVISELKKNYPHIELDLIIPYLTKEINNHKEYYYKKYDNIIMADIPYSTPIRYRILKCNQYMVNNSCCLISYVICSYGGAFQTLEYANKKGIEIFNFDI